LTKSRFAHVFNLSDRSSLVQTGLVPVHYTRTGFLPNTGFLTLTGFLKEKRRKLSMYSDGNGFHIVKAKSINKTHYSPKQVLKY